MSRIAENDARESFQEAEEQGTLPPGDVDARGVRRRHLIWSRFGRIFERARKVRRLAKERSIEVLYSGSEDFPEPDGENF